MKVKQIIYFKFDRWGLGIRNQMEFSDPEGNMIILDLEESDVIELESVFEYKANMIREERTLEAKDHLEDVEQMHLEGDHET